MDKERERRDMRDAEAGYKALVAHAAQVLEAVRGGAGAGTLSYTGLEKLRDEAGALFRRFSVPLLLQNLQLVRMDASYYNYHAVNVALLNMVVGRFMGLDEACLDSLAMIGLCSDFGMLRLPAYIIQGKGKLSDEDFGRIRGHTLATRSVLEKAGVNDPAVLEGVLHHHERYDGSGYPDGLKGEEIPFESRVTTVADWYDAANAKRDYKESKSPFDVLSELISGSGAALDPKITNAAVNGIAESLVGRFVLLSDRTVGRVVSINQRSIRYPVVNVVGKRIQTDENLRPVSLSSFIPLF